jgi:hypothetical protein
VGRVRMAIIITANCRRPGRSRYYFPSGDEAGVRFLDRHGGGKRRAGMKSMVMDCRPAIRRAGILSLHLCTADRSEYRQAVRAFAEALIRSVELIVEPGARVLSVDAASYPLTKSDSSSLPEQCCPYSVPPTGRCRSQPFQRLFTGEPKLNSLGD